jgi:hypothetical protein
MNQPINLRKSRDFGEIISDSFIFLRENFKPLFRSLLAISGIFIVLGTVTTTFQYMGMMRLYKGAFHPDAGANYELNSYSLTYFATIFINLIIILLQELTIYLATMSFISVYLEKNGEKPTLAEVWGYFKYYFFRVTGSGLLLFLLIGVGCVFCFIPGIYLAGVFSIVIPIIVMENASFRYAFNKSFQLVSNNWWFVFGVAVVTGIIVGVINSVASLPITILSLVGSFFAHKGSGQAYMVPLIVFFSLIKNVVILTYTLSNISVALCYFKLSEEKEGLGLLGRMENFGSSTGENTGLPTEEY